MLANAKITVNGQTVITQETGYWEIIGITPGKYTLIASKTGYYFVPKNFVVAGDEHTINLNIDVVNSALCQLYAVNDGGLNRSQFFTTALNSLQVNKLISWVPYMLVMILKH